MSHWIVLLGFSTGIATIQGIDRQSTEYACGPSCLSLAATLLEHPVSAARLTETLGGSLDKAYSLQELETAAQRLGFATRKIHWNQRDCPPHVPIIIPLQPQRGESPLLHFIVVYGGVGEQFQVIDYPRTPQLVPAFELKKGWSGDGLALALTDKELRDLPSAGSRASIGWLFAGIFFLTAGLMPLFWRRRVAIPRLRTEAGP